MTSFKETEIIDLNFFERMQFESYSVCN